MAAHLIPVLGISAGAATLRWIRKKFKNTDQRLDVVEEKMKNEALRRENEELREKLAEQSHAGR